MTEVYRSNSTKELDGFLNTVHSNCPTDVRIRQDGGSCWVASTYGLLLNSPHLRALIQDKDMIQSLNVTEENIKKGNEVCGKLPPAVVDEYLKILSLDESRNLGIMPRYYYHLQRWVPEKIYEQNFFPVYSTQNKEQSTNDKIRIAIGYPLYARKHNAGKLKETYSTDGGGMPQHLMLSILSISNIDTIVVYTSLDYLHQNFHTTLKNYTEDIIMMTIVDVNNRPIMSAIEHCLNIDTTCYLLGMYLLYRLSEGNHVIAGYLCTKDGGTRYIKACDSNGQPCYNFASLPSNYKTLLVVTPIFMRKELYEKVSPQVDKEAKLKKEALEEERRQREEYFRQHLHNRNDAKPKRQEKAKVKKSIVKTHKPNVSEKIMSDFLKLMET